MPKHDRNEWALAVSVSESTLAVPVLLANGERETLRVQSLASRGLPTAGALCARVNDTNLSTWERVPAREYLAGFGLRLDAGAGPGGHSDAEADAGHEVYALTDGGRRFLVPALVLMRAFFRAGTHMLPEMFHPQALDHLCYPDSREPHGVKVTAKWAQGVAGLRLANVAAVLAWLRASPETRELAASVHANAMQGRIALSRVPLIARLVPWGVERDGTVYVTSLSVKLLRLVGQPELPRLSEGVRRGEPGQGKKKEGVNLYGKGAAGNSVAGLAKRLRIVPRPDGQPGLLDAEWLEVEQILNSQKKRKRGGASREIAEAVIAKIALPYRTPWSALGPVGISQDRLATSYYKWAQAGVLEAALKRLNEMREGAAKADGGRLQA